MAKAFVFPGQGSQDVGMGKALADQFASAREVFDEVDDALGEKLTDIMWGRPERHADADPECATGLDGRVSGSCSGA